MVNLTRIYTRTGDLGETSLLGGARVPKDHLRVAAYGDVDETNAALGAVRALAEEVLERLLLGVQKDLFAIGAQLADPTHKVASRRAKAAVKAAQVRRLEKAIDAREAKLPPLRSFVLPGGTPAAAPGDWSVTIEETQRAGEVDLARRIIATRGDVVVRLVVDEYRALPE